MEAQMLEERRERGREGERKRKCGCVCILKEGKKENRRRAHPHRIHEGKEQRRQQNQIKKR
jgi:hypothetical protein